jgi:antitoxin component YwqK of YwqJK toxin-antitoxin module
MSNEIQYGDEEREVKTYYDPATKTKLREHYVIRNHKKNGFFKFYDEDGTLLIECNFVDNIREGLYISYRGNNIKNVRMTFKNDLKEGIQENFFDNGEVKIRTEFVGGKINGKMTEFYPSKNIRMERTYINDILNGQYIVYFDVPEKKIKKICNYINGKIIGDYKEFKKDGTLFRHRIWYFDDYERVEDIVTPNDDDCIDE